MSAREIRPASDSDRVLGQTASGEVRADADAVREIAARHQEAYGAAWAEPTEPGVTAV